MSENIGREFFAEKFPLRADLNPEAIQAGKWFLQERINVGVRESPDTSPGGNTPGGGKAIECHPSFWNFLQWESLPGSSSSRKGETPE